MRLLFEMDGKNYDPAGKAFVRPSVRGIILHENQVAMVHSMKYDYYKFPGGGMEPGESQIETLIREVREEAGFEVLPETIREYGRVYRVQKSDHPDYSMFCQENYYYLCAVSSKLQPQMLDDYEQDEHFTLEFVTPQTAISTNRYHPHGPTNQTMLEREALVLEQLLREGFFSTK